MMNQKSVLLGGVAFIAMFAQAAIAQDATDEDERGEQDVIVVTGTNQAISKKDATYSVNTLDQEDIQLLAPISTADLLQNVPGIFAEGSTAGEASNNITVRGLPVTGGYRYAPQLIDGLPWFEEPEVQFMNNDTAARGDIMTKQVEVVKGGPGGILYSNGLGATVNHITRTGGQTLEGAYRVEVADYNFLRNEGYVSGPINDNLTFAVGGFYRISDGLRDAGFRVDDGGQIRANLLYTSDDQSWNVFAQYHKVADSTAFYQNVPFQVPAFTERGTAENPIEIDTDETFELGLDFGDGTPLSPSTRRITQLGEYGQRQIDFADGLKADFDIFTLKAEKEFSNGWAVYGGLRYTEGTNDFNAMFTGNDSTSASRFLEARYQNDVVSPAYGQALRGECDAAKLAGFFDTSACEAGGFDGATRDDFVNNFALATSVGAFYIDDGSRVADDEILNFLLPFITNTDAKSLSADLRVTKSVNLWGSHDLTFGAYKSEYSNDQNFQSSLIVSTMGDPSRLADLRGVDSAGNVVGPSLTLNGGILPGFFGYVSEIDAEGSAFYILDHWETMDGRLKIDMGVRWQDLQANVMRMDRNIIDGSNLTPDSIVPGSDADTTADDEVFLPSNPRMLDDEFDGFGWSFGGNYSFSRDFAVYGLVSKSFRLPSFEDLNEFRVDSSREEEQVEEIDQYEAGFRFYADNFDTQVAVFYNDFKPRQDSVTFRDFTDPSCEEQGTLVDINTCPEVREFFQRGVENTGIEIEAAWRPGFSWTEGLELRGNAVFQSPEIVGANFRVVRQLTDGNGVTTGFEFEEIGEDGRRPRRLADTMINLQGVWDMRPILGMPFKPYGKYTWFGDRFSESRDVDVTLYPEYFHIDGGFIWDFNEDMAFQFHVANITNELSFTEGDPLFADLKGPNGATNRGVARPLFGRTMRASFTYRF